MLCMYCGVLVTWAMEREARAEYIYVIIKYGTQFLQEARLEHVYVIFDYGIQFLRLY